MITPADTPASPENYDAVPPGVLGPAGYDIQAPLENLGGEFSGSESLAGIRQGETGTLLHSPQGFAVGGYDVDSGYSGGAGSDGWPGIVKPRG